MQNFCLDVEEKETTWRKWCRPLRNRNRFRRPSQVRPELLPEQRRSLAGRFRPAAAPKVKEEEEEEKDDAEYHIEVAPGQWITTTNETEARILLQEQKQAEQNFGEVH